MNEQQEIDIYRVGRITRRSLPPTCLAFGKNRYDKYPDGYFCQNCDWYENEKFLHPKRVNRQSRKYSCHANQWDFIVPRPRASVINRTFLTKEQFDVHQKLKAVNDKMYDDEVSIETIDEHDAEIVPDVTLQMRQQQEESVTEDDIEDDEWKETPLDNVIQQATVMQQQSLSLQSLKNEIKELRKSLSSMQLQLRSTREGKSYWKHKYETISKIYKIDKASSTDEFVEKTLIQLIACEDVQIEGKRLRSREKVRKALAVALWNDKRDFFVSLQHYTMLHARKWLRENVFTAFAILKAMDLSGGSLNLEGIEILRSVETSGKRYFRNGLIPSSASIRRVATTIENYAKSRIPYQYGNLPNNGGEYIHFSPKELFAAVIKAFKLDVVARERGIIFHQSIDGALLTKFLSHLTYGIKVADRAATCPFTGKPIWGIEDSIMQSRNTCFPVFILMKRENKETVLRVKPIIQEVMAFADPGCKWFSDYQPLELPFNADLSAIWKLLGYGGAVKRDTVPCHCCAVLSDDLVLANNERCEKWCRLGEGLEDDDKCYHQPFLSNERMEYTEEIYKEMASTITRQGLAYDDLKKVASKQERAS